MAMAGNNNEIASTRAELYIKSYRKLLRFLIYCNILTLILILGIIYVVFLQPEPSYYAATARGLLIVLNPS